MTGDDATPTPPDPEGHHLLGKTITGWEEIRQALEFVEGLRKQQEHADARIELYEISEESSLIVTLRSVRELDDFRESRLRKRLLKKEENLSRQLDVMSESQGKFVLR
jgi:hypothetical protein